MKFSDDDRKLIEGMVYDKCLKPRFDQLKSCFFGMTNGRAEYLMRDIKN